MSPTNRRLSPCAEQLLQLCQAMDPVATLEEWAAGGVLEAGLRGVDPGLLELQVLLLREQRLHDLLGADPGWAAWFAEEPGDFARMFGEFLAAVPCRSPEPEAEAREFRAYLEFWA